MNKITCIPGFLGSEKDYDFLDDALILDWETLLKEPLGQGIGSSDYLVGYSMGARIAIKLKLLYPNRFKRVILLAGHFGLENTEEIKERASWDEKILSLLSEKTEDQFLEYWNSLPVFLRDETLNHSFDYELMLNVFKRFQLSKQGNLWRDYRVHSRDTIYFYGENDAKYKAYAQKLKNDLEIREVKNAGHRLLRSKEVQVFLRGLQ